MKKWKYIGLALLAICTLVAVPGCRTRTGTLYSETRFSAGMSTVMLTGASMWGSGPHRDAFSTTLGIWGTFHTVLIAWWWDTLMLPYDLYLLSDGIDFHVYDQDGRLVPKVRITAYGSDSGYDLDKETDEHGHLYLPRREKSFTYMSAEKTGYFGYRFGQGFWMPPKDPNPPMFDAKFTGREVVLPTTNGEHVVNLYLKKVPDQMPRAEMRELAISNLEHTVEYKIDLERMELMPPHGNGMHGDMTVVFPNVEPGMEIPAATVSTLDSKACDLQRDRCVGWSYPYYEPAGEELKSRKTTGYMHNAWFLKSRHGGKDFKAFGRPWHCERRCKPTDPRVVRLKYWLLPSNDAGVLPCHLDGPRKSKVVSPKK